MFLIIPSCFLLRLLFFSQSKCLLSGSCQKISPLPPLPPVGNESLYSFSFPEFSEDREKAEAVKEAALHIWNSYKTKCWGHDAIKPVTGTCKDIFNGGLFIIDSIDTLFLMNLSEYLEAKEYILNEFKFDGSYSMFETSIRVLGGLLSIYELTQDDGFFQKALQLANAMYPHYDDNGFYGGSISLKTINGTLFATSSKFPSCLAAYGSYQLEFAKLTEKTHNPKFIEKAMRVYRRLWSKSPDHGLITHHQGGTDVKNGKVYRGYLGAEYDSYYEYIPKLFVLTNGVQHSFIERHIMTMNDLKQSAILKTKSNKIVMTGITEGSPNTHLEHLSAFLPAAIAVGSVKSNPNWYEDLEIAGKMVDFYAEIFRGMKSRLMPEAVSVRDDIQIIFNDYQLRPEVAESICMMFKFTGLPKYREMAWDLFIGLNRSARVQFGFSRVNGIDSDHTTPVDEEESFFLAETMKYLYLTFSDSKLLHPTEWVFNTEAHPLRVMSQKEAKYIKKYLPISSAGLFQ